MTSGSDGRYHHGDLPNALRAAAVEVIAEHGVAGFSLREVARRAGVSHAAPAHHFGSATGLLTALAVDAFAHLAEAIEAATAPLDDPVDKLFAAGRAYVEVGRDFPAQCAVVFRPDVVDATDPAYHEWGERAFGALVRVVEGVRDRYNPELDVDLAAMHCWSTMQGLLTIYPVVAARAASHGLPLPSASELATAFGAITLQGLLGRPERT